MLVCTYLAWLKKSTGIKWAAYRKGCRSCSCLCLMATMCDHEALHLLTMITVVIRFHVPRGTCKLGKRPRALPYQCGTVRSRAKSFCLSAKHARSLRNTLSSGSTSLQGTFVGPACADSDLESQGVVLLNWRRTSEASLTLQQVVTHLTQT